MDFEHDLVRKQYALVYDCDIDNLRFPLQGLGRGEKWGFGRTTHLAVLRRHFVTEPAEELVRGARASVQRFDHFRCAECDVRRRRVLLLLRFLVDVDVDGLRENTEANTTTYT